MEFDNLSDTPHDNHDSDLENIVKEYGSSIVKYCYNLLWDYHEAQDAAQEVFLAAMIKMAGLRDRAAYKTWLYRVAHNICMDILRRRKRAGLFQKRESADIHVDNYDFGISRELQAALNTLSPIDRALVYNRAVDEMDYAELEEIYGMKSTALRKRYERARKKLEEELRKGAAHNG